MKFTFDTDILAALNELSDAQAGRLFKMIYEYCRGNKNVDSFFERKGDTMMRIIFAPIRAAIDREEERAREIGRKRAQAGAKGGRQANLSKCKQMVANGSKCKQMVANEAFAKNDDFTSLIIDDNNIINNNLSLSYKEKFVEATLSDCWRELRSDQSWREVVTINTRSAGYDWFTLEQFDTYLDNFFRELENRDNKLKSPADAKAHFAAWLKIELSKESKQYVTTAPTNKQPRAKGAKRNTPAASATSIESVKL